MFLPPFCYNQLLLKYETFLRNIYNFANPFFEFINLMYMSRQTRALINQNAELIPIDFWIPVTSKSKIPICGAIKATKDHRIL